MSYIKNGVLENGSMIGKAKVISNALLKAGHAIPYKSFKPQSITVHETGCPDVNALTMYKSLFNANIDTTRRKASYHIVVDAYHIRQCVNLLKTTWHAGCKEGNDTSIGIEICQYLNNKSKQKQAYENAAKLIKIIKDELNINVVLRHYDWTKKQCPSYLITKKYEGLTWDWFTSLLEENKKYTKLQNGTHNKKFRVITNNLNVRSKRPSEDGTLGDIEWVLKNGDVVNIGYVFNGWGSIWSEGDVGYINTSSKYIEAVKN